ncbi:unnamed protein product, partial [Schistocephalus solidus]|uniref:LID domain-containing protein n=1 Tax=Schistocephalus solidus TaxID=70667 RepID=A0A183SSB3_SCHSO
DRRSIFLKFLPYLTSNVRPFCTICPPHFSSQTSSLSICFCFRHRIPSMIGQPEYRIFDAFDSFWWETFVTDFFEDDATMIISVMLEDGPKRFSKFSLRRTLIPRYFRSIFESGCGELYFNLRATRDSFHNPVLTLDSDCANMVMNIIRPLPVTVVVEGRLSLDFTADELMRIRLWTFQIRTHRELIMRSLLTIQLLLLRIPTQCPFGSISRSTLPNMGFDYNGGSLFMHCFPPPVQTIHDYIFNFPPPTPVQDVMIVGEPTLMGGDFGEDDERLITRLENTQYDAAAAAAAAVQQQQQQQMVMIGGSGGGPLPPSFSGSGGGGRAGGGGGFPPGGFGPNPSSAPQPQQQPLSSSSALGPMLASPGGGGGAGPMPPMPSQSPSGGGMMYSHHSHPPYSAPNNFCSPGGQLHPPISATSPGQQQQQQQQSHMALKQSPGVVSGLGPYSAVGGSHPNSVSGSMPPYIMGPGSSMVPTQPHGMPSSAPPTQTAHSRILSPTLTNSCTLPPS